MTAEPDITKTGATAPGVSTHMQIAEQLADSLWRITEIWNDFVRMALGVPLTRAMDEIGLQLRLSLGRTTIKHHLQHIENARRALISVEYYLQRAHRRGLIDAGQTEPLRSQIINLAQRLDQHRVSIVQATNQKIAEQKQQQEKNAQAAQVESKASVKKETSAAH